jgi:hypothetical protein
MPEVAIFALSRLHNGMNILKGEVLLRKLLMTVETFFSLELPLLRPGGSVAYEECRYGKRKNHTEDRQSPLERGGRHTLSRVEGNIAIWIET